MYFEYVLCDHETIFLLTGLFSYLHYGVKSVSFHSFRSISSDRLKFVTVTQGVFIQSCRRTPIYVSESVDTIHDVSRKTHMNSYCPASQE